MKKPVCLLCVVFACGLSAFAQDDAARARSPNRVTIAVLSMENLSGDTNAAHCQDSIPKLLGWQMEGVVSSIRFVPTSSTWFAYNELGLSKSNAITEDLARNIGKIAEARYVFWGAYKKEGKNWAVTAQMIQTATGKISKKWNVTSTNWLSIGNELVGKIIQQAGVTPTAEEKRLLLRPITRSPEALEIILRVASDSRTGKPMAALESEARRAVSLDPEFARAWYALAVISANTAKLDDAVEYAMKAVSLNPDAADGHCLLGAIYIVKQNFVLAKTELMKAIKLDPDDWQNFQRLSEISSFNNMPEEEASYLTKARQLAPYESEVRAELGRAYARLGKIKPAYEELKAAEKFRRDDSIQGVIGGGYELLNAVPETVGHYEKFLSFMDKRGIRSQDEEVKRILNILPGFKARLTPHFINDQAPRTYTNEELSAALKQRLSPEEYGLTDNPLVCTPEMKKWAGSLVADAHDPMEKARLLFTGLTGRGHFGRGMGKRTATEAFRVWPDSSIGLTCQEFAFLYVSLARAVGLDAFFVDVDRECEGRAVLHRCACVFLPDGKALLADPAFLWFGAPHQHYRVMNDLEVVGLYSAESEILASNKIAVKLIPDFQEAHLNEAMGFANQGQLKEARAALKTGLELEPNSWLGYFTQGMIEAIEHKWDDVAAQMRQSIALNPDYAQSHYVLGRALVEQRNYREARDAFRLALEGDLPADMTVDSRKAIAKINEAYGDH